MQISPYKFNCLSYSPNFSARSEDIKTADLLMRKARKTFPMMSATYADDFYTVLNGDTEKSKRANEITQKLWDRILEMREKCDEAEKYSSYSAFDAKSMYDLSQILKNRAGNCTESSKAAFAVLCANGYYNSARVNLFYKVEFVNKKTKEKEYSAASNLDHSFAITDLNKREKMDIIIDPWLGFADFKSGASARFKSLYGEDLKRFETMHKKLFNINKLQHGEEIDFEDYEMRTEFVFHEAESSFKHGKEKFGALAAKEYPGLLLDVSV